ncbi:MAG: magnesium transporter [Coriobacteriia bacterium]|nr:magnesium transporter [Coriobacteriia bacterium]
MSSREHDTATMTLIREHLGARRPSDTLEAVESMSVAEMADVLRELSAPERAALLRLLPREVAADVFSQLARQERDDILWALTDTETKHLLASLAPDDRTELFEELPGEMTQKLLNLLSGEDLAEVRRFLGYPEESVGRLATPDYVAVAPDWNVAQALEHIRRRGRESETVDVIYVAERGWRLVGVCELRSLILAAPESPVADVMHPVFARLSAFDDREEAVREMRRHDTVALPVVDSSGVLIGIVTADDVFDVFEEEATEDVHRTASVSPLRASYRELSAVRLYRKRVGWLLALLVFSLVSSGVIAAYEGILASVVALAFFIPLLADTGGNTGSQSSMLVVRALVTEDIGLDDWWRVAGKEVGVGLLIGGTLGIGAFMLGALRADFSLGLVVALAMAGIVIAANLIGTLLPFLLVRLGQDPTVASSPLVTSLTDAVGLLIYFGIATLLLVGHTLR